ncbi:MAG: hypothetical protein A2Y03_05485 [Omnitrophica WOR_2 bacterium GWF2_38_59]|nr:MAG: hypothetical protein A2Y06_07280 [Omnitrophica WOR_2 bacterium GWA2_37_7]OGX23033.1 MAG: hypothetical protein A2Y03_05485 [Omnitrophica WOR_2 bacterium GWF2_38_59]OGX51229.1 MAG: hypothetical protein A2243_05270 [Omnitrophica WOR_2 bacterium RIFOXYA2_FULL_38_17]OGX54808.1 MAG: hypothetical protein A2267_06160 [Omnitrophica WOR_2 bacterium RIFOXYA12_FULL_38_10]OGX55350.1 MAG: hypothetical protein A2306_06620 [Omnitrophica WOR_2 bacterium RIFOXYB2_FULL_38_16]OGX57939.1 MAG: hypothetical 
MLTYKTVLALMLFGMIYPLIFLFWHAKKSSYRKHITYANIASGLTVVYLLLSHIPFNFKLWVIFWKITLLASSSYNWRKKTITAQLFLVQFFAGIYVFYLLFTHKPLYF